MKNDIKAIRRSLAILATIAVFSVAYFARDLVLPVVLGFLLALTLSPLNRSLQRFGLSSGVSATILVLMTAFSILAVVYFAGETVRSWSGDIPSILHELRMKLRGVSDAIEAVKDASDQVEKMAVAPDAGTQEVVIKQPGLVNSAVTAAASSITSLAVALILALFLLGSGDLFYIKLVQAYPLLSDKKRVLTTIYDIERRVSGYLFTITIINAGLGLTIGMALWLVGLEYAYIWGIAAFLLNYLPILGGIIGTVLIGAHSILYFDSLSYAFVAPVVYQILTSSEAQFVTPYLIGKRMELNVAAVFLTIILWAWLWGIVGALVAVPFLVVFKVVCDNFENLRPLGNFLSSTSRKQ